MVGNYTYLEVLAQVVDLKRRVNIDNVMTVRNFINRAARMVLNDVDLRSSKRNTVLGTDLFDDIYSYPAPSDLKGNGVIDLDPQVNRSRTFRLELVSEQEFEQKKTVNTNIIALATDELVHRLLFSGDVDDTVLVGATLDSLTSEGTWSAYNDATNVVTDADNFVKGAGSIKFDLTGSATTAGIQNTTITALDISDFTNNGHIFVWAYINSTTNLTNFILDIGNDLTTNYYSQTITTNNEAVSFYNGWNLLRFDFASMTENGTVDDTAVDSMRIYMTKTSGKSDDGYRFDSIELHTGEIHDIIYYSRFAWQSSAGTFLEDSTADTDLINAETDEVDGFVWRSKMELYRELRRKDLVEDARVEYELWKRNYQRQNPSERVQRNKQYYDPTLYRRAR
ncbi:hypothetical protein LCGC14_1503090 [marine sediment metagenome]|uniref:Uncharacterized protein n=1 Tax=marine sediment metagenome TaxID=412755 RepID=A0A0F9J431_9ZZZZ